MNGFNDPWSGYLPIVDAEPAGGIAGLRLLPWTGPDGKPAYTPEGNPLGLIAQIADDMEASQLQYAREVLSTTQALLDEPSKLDDAQARYVIRMLCGAVSDTLRVAKSRGMRLTIAGADE
ncbi:hypothetical protein ABZZ36_35280 [Actinacidiphila glaucinigra]|uniref:hypothetical protein n=1 Tax=Actinacidiphila glaucinigra TaxID=235986 RepID=UPI0033B08C9D